MIHRKIKDTNPMLEVPTYLKSTSTTVLCQHLNVKHLEIYQRAAQENGWDISQARSQARREAAALQLGRQDEFTERLFHKHLLDFVIADDQVRPRLSYFYIHYTHVELEVCERHRTSRIQATPPLSMD